MSPRVPHSFVSMLTSSHRARELTDSPERSDIEKRTTVQNVLVAERSRSRSRVVVTSRNERPITSVCSASTARMTPARLTRAGTRRERSDYHTSSRSRASNARETRDETRVSMKLSDDAAPDSIASVRASTRVSRKRSRDVVIESAQSFVKSSRRRAAVSDDEDESDVVATVRAADGGDDATPPARRETPVESSLACAPRTRRETKDHAFRQSQRGAERVARNALRGCIVESVRVPAGEGLGVVGVRELVFPSPYATRRPGTGNRRARS